MYYKILGYERKTGEYQGHQYDNIYLHAATVNPRVTGEQVDRVKVKTAMLNEVLNQCGCSLNELVGQTVDLSFDRYSSLEYLDLVAPSGK